MNAFEQKTIKLTISCHIIEIAGELKLSPFKIILKLRESRLLKYLMHSHEASFIIPP